MKPRGWLAYLVGGLLFSNELSEIGLIVFLVGTIVDWKFWSLGIVAFFLSLSVR